MKKLYNIIAVINIYFFIGTTAEFIKLAPVIKELRQRNIPFKLITSGQNEINFNAMSEYTGTIKPYLSLPEKPHQSSIFLFLIWAIQTFFRGLITLHKEFKNVDKKNTYFIIHGDTVSSLIGAILARCFGLQLIHIEAGLRSFHFLEPFPEEICRFIINALSHVNFCQNEWSMNNLKNSHSKKIDTKQNTLIEIFWWAIKKKMGLEYAKKFSKYYILIMHRQEHIYFNKKWTKNMIQFIINHANKDLNCLFVMLPVSSSFVQSEKTSINKSLSKKLFFIPKLGYPEFMTLMKNAEFIATDGCTNQEEVYYMGLPCLSLRHRTERIEGLNENVVISKDNKKLMKNFLKNYKDYRRESVYPKESPSKIIVDYLLK